MRSDAPFLVEYYDPRCSSCAAFAPVWEELTTASWHIELHFATLSIEAGLDSATLKMLTEQGLPNVQLFLPNHGNDERGQRLRPEQRRVMAGLESAGMTSKRRSSCACSPWCTRPSSRRWTSSTTVPRMAQARPRWPAGTAAALSERATTPPMGIWDDAEELREKAAETGLGISSPSARGCCCASGVLGFCETA